MSAAPPCTETVGTVAQLRTAVGNANASGVEYVICVSPGTYRLDPADGHLLFTPGPKVTVAGTGASPDLHVLSGDFDGGGTPDVRLIATQRVLVIENMTLEFGNGLNQTAGSFDDGGAILATANVEIIDSIVRDNAVGGGKNGGAIYGNPGASVTITNSELSNNSGNFGGAVVSEQEVVISGSAVSGNTATADGGAVIVLGSATIDDSTFNNNFAFGAGGAVASFSTGVTTVRDSVFVANLADGVGQILLPPGGGALNAWEVDSVTIEDSTFDFNDATTNGGAVATQLVPDVAIRRSLVLDNFAAAGGGVHVQLGERTSIEDSLFVLNTASGSGAAHNGGGLFLFDSGLAAISGTTFADNLAADEGGALFTFETSLSLVNSTASENTATTGGAFIGAAGLGGYTIAFDHVTAGNGQELLVNPSEGAVDLTLTNSVLDGCQLTNASVTTSSNNFDTNGGCALAGPGDISGADPGLGALADNGGKVAGAPVFTGVVETLLPLAGSPLIDVAGGALATDQRGVARPMGNGPDIGAVEVEDEVIEPVEPITAADTTVQDEMGVPKLVDLSQLVTTPSTTPVLYEVVSVTPGGGATSIQGSVLTFRRALGFTDDVEVVYRVTDDEGQTAEATVTFTLEPTLPETGSDSGLLALFGVLFVAVGGLMLQTSRRPRLRSTI